MNNLSQEIGITFKTLKKTEKFYKDYSKLADKLLSCPTRIYVYILKDVGFWIISKVLNHSHFCCPNRVEMLKHHRELSMFVRRTIENNEEVGIRLSKTYQSFIAAAGSHCELSFIEKDVKNYITREVRNIFEQDDAKEFGKNWNDFLTKYGVRGNKWLLELYEDRHLWISIYLDHHFWPGMRSTKGARACMLFFNKFITRNSSLIQFVKGKVNCITRSTYSTLGFTAYEVVKQVSNSAFNKFVKCQCLLFVSRGILCRHYLSALSFERVDKVTPKYILKRWSKNIKRRHTHIKSSQDGSLLEPRSKRFDDLVFRSHNICEFVSDSEELTEILHRAFDNVMAKMQEYQTKSKGKYSLSHEDATLSDVNNLQSLPCVRTRGRPKNRLGSKEKKNLALSELNLLNGGSMIPSSSSLYHA
ncbi:hypothetical protein Ahy_B02g061261 [Arachis hypogaea]|uniref:SWIM-type domain-containing protein n=1 Tax=Arachis hypogaea TaxID=3818 RepID=A0A445AKH4_ARAHY|nr:hypothetical protein Ahy_B02g061261 [Arachis hypogaea]